MNLDTVTPKSEIPTYKDAEPAEWLDHVDPLLLLGTTLAPLTVAAFSPVGHALFAASVLPTAKLCLPIMSGGSLLTIILEHLPTRRKRLLTMFEAFGWHDPEDTLKKVRIKRSGKSKNGSRWYLCKLPPRVAISDLEKRRESMELYLNMDVEFSRRGGLVLIECHERTPKVVTYSDFEDPNRRKWWASDS